MASSPGRSSPPTPPIPIETPERHIHLAGPLTWSVGLPNAVGYTSESMDGQMIRMD
ncbi:hypothetical protein ACRALDRAFT_1064372 [Sodiomyces alcalophilus JCM 7366]|uniref:uncharacterized protein n=1 Tax=Sodiomyces alcalophilus JCM 7366 TaxID=591952 RepID=UPI0039B36A3B